MENYFILASQTTICISLIDTPKGITSSAIGLKICPITAEIKKYRLLIKKKKKKHDEIVF